MIASGGCRPAELTASAAVVAVATSYPAPRRFVCSARRNCGSSSTTSTRWPVKPEPRRAAPRRGARARTTHPGRAATRPRAGRRSPRRSPARSRARGPALADRAPPGTRWNGSKIRSRSSSGIPGPRSVTRMRSSCLVALTRMCTGSPGGDSLSAFSSTLTSARWIWTASTLTGGRSGRVLTWTRVGLGQLLERLRDELVRGPELRDRLGGSRLEPREVEKVLDEPLEAGVLHANRPEQLLSILRPSARERRSRARRGPARSSRAASAGRARPPGSAPS